MGRAINGTLGYPEPDVYQILPQFAQGEDVSLTFALTSDSNPSSWVATQLTLIPEGKNYQGQLTLAGTISGVSSTGPPYVATVAFALPAATTAALGAGSAVWSASWTDSGNDSVLGSGEIGIVLPVNLLPW